MGHNVSQFSIQELKKWPSAPNHINRISAVIKPIKTPDKMNEGNIDARLRDVKRTLRLVLRASCFKSEFEAEPE